MLELAFLMAILPNSVRIRSQIHLPRRAKGINRANPVGMKGIGGQLTL
jgi:hypothetical protein